MNRNLVFVLVLSAFMACSCGSYHRLAYLQDMQVDYEYTAAPKPDARIQKDDRLRIVVTCTSPELAAPFNVVSGSVHYNADVKAVLANGVQKDMEKGYLVDQEGNITFPVIGKLQVEGLTLEELKSVIEGQIKGRNYIKDPFVYVEFLNFEVLLIGEAGVGRYYIPNGGIDIFELLAMSGDLRPDAIRDDIRVIRTENGTRKAYSINLKSVECYNSPVFHLKQNDMVYALPKDSKLDTATSNAFYVLSMCLSTISTVGTIILWTRLRK